MNSSGKIVRDALDHERYGAFLRRCADGDAIWAIWGGDDWALAQDPSRPEHELFLLWSTSASAQASFDANRGKFSEGAVVEAIQLTKWIESYTPDLIKWETRAFIDANSQFKGLIVDPADLASNLKATANRAYLQGSDIGRLKRAVRAKHGADDSGRRT